MDDFLKILINAAYAAGGSAATHGLQYHNPAGVLAALICCALFLVLSFLIEGFRDGK